jgi:hypothetical protein
LKENLIIYIIIFFGIFYKNKEWARGVVLFLILKNNQRFDLKGKIKNYY